MEDEGRQVNGEEDIGGEEVSEEDEDEKGLGERGGATGDIMWKEWLAGSDMGDREIYDGSEDAEIGVTVSNDY